ncbi:hypothetical protein [Microbacterium sp.]|uniref:hypothetical protein n=1 Tax=Microbacterium sp. TaxID=51671 RepID=UPI003342185F
MSTKEDPIVVARRVLDRTFEVYVTSDGSPFAVPRDGGRAIMLTPRGEGAALGVLRLASEGESPRVPRSALVEALTWAHDLAPQTAPVADLHLRAAQPKPGMIVLDLGEMNSTRCIVITRKGWKARDRPPAGVHFRLSRATRALPEPKHGAHGHKTLRRLLGWSKKDGRWLMARGWLAAALFPDIARPLLFATGTAGSGKTFRGRVLASVLDPRDELGGSLGKDERDALVAAGARYIAAWDNITSVSIETSNLICRLVTGGSDERRVLYSDEDVHVRAIRRTGIITALSLPMLEADALERIIPVHCETIPSGERTSESRMRAAFDDAHPQILGAVLDDVVRVLGQLPEVQATKRSRPRMADFSDVLYALDPAIDNAYREATADMVREVAEGDPFIGAVADWLRGIAEKNGLPFTMAPSDALTALRASLPPFGRHDAYLPKTPSGLSQMLTKNAGPLRSLGFSVTRKTVRGAKYDVYDRAQEEKP